MPTREQLTAERVRTLLKELQKGEIINPEEAEKLRKTREFNESEEIREKTPEPPALTRNKVEEETKKQFKQARSKENIQKQIDILFHIITGENPRSSN